MLRTFTCLPATAAFLLYSAVIPPALSSDEPKSEEASTSVAVEAKVETAIPSEKTDASETKNEAQSAAVDTSTNSLLADASAWVCRKEMPTGSHRTIKVCRRAADIEADSAEVEQTMNRQRHYGNSSVTPQD